MQNSKKWSPAIMQPENSDITTWVLPEGAITRLGQGIIMGNIAPSPDGKHLAVGSCAGVWWYDVSTMTPIALWDTARGYISAVSFSPNGKWLATGDGDGLVKVWDVQRGSCISEMERDEKVAKTLSSSGGTLPISNVLPSLLMARFWRVEAMVAPSCFGI